MSIIQMAGVFFTFWIIGALQVVTIQNDPDLWWLALLTFVPMATIISLVPWNKENRRSIIVGLLISITASQLLRWWF